MRFTVSFNEHSEAIMWRALGQTYCDAWQFTKALPMLLLLLFVLEGAQHVVEWITGFYADAEMMKEASAHPLRLTLGVVKTVVGLLLGYWVIRYLMSNGSLRYTTASDPTALRRYIISMIGYLLISAGVLLFVAIAGSRFSTPVPVLVLIAFLGALIRTLLSFWMVGSAIADPAATFGSSIRKTWGSVLWGITLTIIAAIPPIALLYAIGYGGLGASKPLLMTMLIVDSAVVAFLYALLASTQAQIARHVMQRSGHTLTASATPSS